jgi:hypothetical protein
MAVFVIDALMPWRRGPSAAATRGGECCVGSDAARNARRLALADAEALRSATVAPRPTVRLASASVTAAVA